MRSRTQLLIAFVSALAVTLVALSETRRKSPGPLASVHQREPDLAGRNDCSACHGGLFGDMREACLECHEPIAAQLTAQGGLHGQLGARAEQCGLCHAEHNGASAPLVHGQSFALAGVAPRSAFDHATIGWLMDGAHAPLECAVCHEHADAALLPQGATRFLGLDQDCATCHEDAHEGQRVLACAACHGQTEWKELASPEHARVLPLIGGHGGLTCAQCHAEGTPHALEVLGGKGPKPAARACVACHDSPHAAGFVEGVGALGNLAPGVTCVVCHAAEHASFHELALLAMTPAQHAASGFTLEAPHDTQACTDCHDPSRNRFAARYPGREAGQCSACHADVHAGQFEEGPFAAEECSACHEPTRWEPHAFTPEKHALGALELSGKHLELACEKCHEKASAEAARVFRGTPDACVACHRDAHDGAFAPFVAASSPPPHGLCARCHDAARFANAATSFDHARFTPFAVRGAHEQSGCESCHEPTPEPDAAGRTFGRVAQVFGEFEGCATCHEDPHDGRFDAPGLPAAVEGLRACARCHAESSFRALPRAFEHGFWTGFALSGAHAEAQCAACHEPLPGGDDVGRTMAQAPGARCSDCHEDPHANQFADEQGLSDCARCHDAARAAFLSFDHERDARFALGDAHAALECAACHATETRADLAVVRFRPLGIECQDCHGNNTEVLLRRLPRKK